MKKIIQFKLLKMCLFPRFIRNKRYYAYNTKKPKEGTPYIECDDERKLYVPIGCGECIECRKQKAQQWRVRLMEEIKVNKYKYFVTLTFSNEELIKLYKETNAKDDNEIATIAVRRFLERWRKKYKKSLKHWFITELGQENTERIHLHGIIFSDKMICIEDISKIWKYGLADIGEYCNERTINYIVKYVTKIDTLHKDYKNIILCSSGLGSSFINTIAAKNTYKYIKGETKEYYTLNNGMRVALPIYYRNKLFTESERQKMWTDRLNKGIIYVNGIKIRNVNTIEGQRKYYELLAAKQEWNNELGYGNTEEKWQKKVYHNTFKMLQNRENTKKE